MSKVLTILLFILLMKIGNSSHKFPVECRFLYIKIFEIIFNHFCFQAEICRIEDRLSEQIELKKFLYLMEYNRLATDDILTIEKYDLPLDSPIDIPFKSSSEIIGIMEDFENRNLSLIGHYQNSEEELDGIRKSHHKTIQNFDKQLDMLKVIE